MIIFTTADGCMRLCAVPEPSEEIVEVTEDIESVEDEIEAVPDETLWECVKLLYTVLTLTFKAGVWDDVKTSPNVDESPSWPPHQSLPPVAPP